jgi:hypothetical protein
MAESRSDVGNKPLKPGAGYRLPLVGPEPQSKDATGGTTAPCSSSAMSSGRLFLDRAARQHCPSPLHRQLHPKTVPGWGTMDLQRMANSVLTVCLSKRDSRTLTVAISTQEKDYRFLHTSRRTLRVLNTRTAVAVQHQSWGDVSSLLPVRQRRFRISPADYRISLGENHRIGGRRQGESTGSAATGPGPGPAADKSFMTTRALPAQILRKADGLARGCYEERRGDRPP